MHVGCIAALQQQAQQQQGGKHAGQLATHGVAAYNARQWQCCLQLRQNGRQAFSIVKMSRQDISK
jgi:hypothetical protein